MIFDNERASVVKNKPELTRPRGVIHASTVCAFDRCNRATLYFLLAFDHIKYISPVSSVVDKFWVVIRRITVTPKKYILIYYMFSNKYPNICTYCDRYS